MTLANPKRPFLGLALLVLLAAPAPAQLGPLHAAHEDDAWENDRQPPYAGPGWSAAQGGAPGVAFPSSGVALRSWIPVGELDAAATGANDLWGYTSPSGREYALVGLSTGTGFVEVSDPDAPQLVAVLPGPTSSWRDLKTYQHYAYAVSEAGGGIQVFDLSQIDAGTVSLVNTVTTGGRLASHNVAVNATSGRLYRAGGGGNNPPLGLRIYDLADPGAPAFVGAWHDRYCHDVQVVTWQAPPYAGSEVAFCYANDTTAAGSPGIAILDASDPTSVAPIGSIDLSLPPIFSHPASYSHQGWLSPDRSHVYFNDEVDEAAQGVTTTTRVIDVSDLANPVQVATFSNGNSARDHNLATRGPWIFEANYRSGLRVFRADDPLAPVEVAFFDTYPEDDAPHYNGLWGVYPFLPSGVVLGSDIEKGLFVWTLELAAVPASSLHGGLAALALIAAAGVGALRRPLSPDRGASRRRRPRRPRAARRGTRAAPR